MFLRGSCTCGCLCAPCSAVSDKPGFSPLTPALSLKSLIGPHSPPSSALFEHHGAPVFKSFLPAVFSPPFGSRWLAGRQEEEAGSPIVPASGVEKREGKKKNLQLRAKSVRNVKHRWPLTHRWVHGKGEGLLCSISPALPFLSLSALSPYTLLCLLLARHPALPPSLFGRLGLPVRVN